MKEYADFLAGQSPFDVLDPEDLQRLVREVEVEYVTAGTVVVPEGATVLTHLWVVRTGAIELLDHGQLVDLLGPGDSFGHVSLFSGGEPTLVARAAEDCLLYRLPDPRDVLAAPDLLRFKPYGQHVRSRLRADRPLESSERAVDANLRPLVRCAAGTTVSEAAAAATAARQSCVVVELRDGLGIVTDSDFRRALAAGVSAEAPVETIATVPVLSVPGRTPVTRAFLVMIEHDIHHLVVVDGAGRPVGVVRVVDLASAEIRDPLLVRKAIEAATTSAQLEAAAALLPSTVVELADANVAVTHIGALLSVVREALVLKGIDLLVDDESSGARAWPRRSWLVLGSLARREPLPSSDLDTALVWDDAPDDAATARTLRGAADRLLDGMERCGLNRCPDGANASNPLFSRSQAHWVAAVTTWIREPNRERALLLAAMMADSRPISDLPLGRTVIDAMLAAARPETFLPLLLNFTLAAHPPTGFFRDFVVEHSGEHRGRLDLKGGGLLPVAALGRWVAMVTGDDRGTTPDRLRRGAGAGVLTDDEAEVLVGAFELFYGLLLDSEVESIRAGRLASTYLAPGDLDSLTRRYLKEAFREVARVQRRVEGEWVSRLT